MGLFKAPVEAWKGYALIVTHAVDGVMWCLHISPCGWCSVEGCLLQGMSGASINSLLLLAGGQVSSNACLNSHHVIVKLWLWCLIQWAKHMPTTACSPSLWRDARAANVLGSTWRLADCRTSGSVPSAHLSSVPLVTSVKDVCGWLKPCGHAARTAALLIMSNVLEPNLLRLLSGRVQQPDQHNRSVRV